MRVLVFGAGAIGSFLGHRLATAGHDVTLLGRSAYVRAVQQRGLILEESDVRSTHFSASPVRSARVSALAPDDVRSAHVSALAPDDVRSAPISAPTPNDVRSTHFAPAVHPAAAERLSDLPADQRHWDLILLTVKVYDTAEGARALAPCLAPRQERGTDAGGSQPRTPVLLVQNGVGGEELARAVLPEALLLSGALTLSVSVLAPGHIRLETSRGGLNLAPTQAGQEVRPWATLFAAAGLRLATYPDYRAMKWTKLLLNIQANAIPAILDMPPGDVYAHPGLFAVERAAFLEALAVMHALKLSVVSFPNYPVPLLAWTMQYLPATLLRPLLTHRVASGRGDKKPSLQMDLAGGRQQSEALYLNGAVVTHAERLGVDVPANKVLLGTLLGIAAGRQSWDEFRGQPERLLHELE